MWIGLLHRDRDALDAGCSDCSAAGIDPLSLHFDGLVAAIAELGELLLMYYSRGYRDRVMKYG